MKKRLRLEPGEQVVVNTLAHPAKLLRPAIILILAVFLHALLQRMLEVRWRPMEQPWTSIHTVLEISLSLLLVLVLLLAVVRPVLRWARTHFVLTDRRLMLIGGAAPREGVRIPLARLQGLEAQPARGPVGSAGIGTLSADFGQAGTLRLHYAPRVTEFGRLIERKAATHRMPMNPYGGQVWPGHTAHNGAGHGLVGGRW